MLHSSSLLIMFYIVVCILGFPGNSDKKDPPAVQKTRDQSLDGEDPLEKEMATHSSILAWRIPWIKESGGLIVHGVTKSQTRLSSQALTPHWVCIC